MRKALSTFLLIAMSALTLSACNSQSSGASGAGMMPNAPQLVAGYHHTPHDSGPADLHAGGATFPAYAYNLGNQPTGCAQVGCSSSAANNPQAPPGTGSLFDAVPTTGTIFYCLTGSGFGRGAWENPNGDSITGVTTAACAPIGATATGLGGRVDPPDFVGSDIAMTSTTDYTTYKTDREPVSGTNYGEPFQMPVIGGPIVYGYRQKDFSKVIGTETISLSTWTMCAIANGTISDWNDAAITKDNGGKSVTGGVSKTITFYFRSDKSGTSYLFTTHLAGVCKHHWAAPYNVAPYESNGRDAFWAYGANQLWPGPGCSTAPTNCPTNANFIGENGNPGVLNATASTRFGMGYLEGAWAASSPVKITQMCQQNGWVGATKGHPAHALMVCPTDAAAVDAAFKNLSSANIQYGEGSDGNPIATASPGCILYIPPSAFTFPPAGTYPIIGVSYLMFYGQNNTHYADLMTMIKFLTNRKPYNTYSPNANAIESSLEYVPLASSIQVAAYQAATGTVSTGPYHGHAACVKP